jgi:hypothetical protein
MQVLQSMMELQKDVSSIGTKTDRLIADVGTLSTRVGGLSDTLIWVKGFAIASIVLIPTCAVIIWWLAGGKIEQMRDELLAVRKPPAVSEPATPRRQP